MDREQERRHFIHGLEIILTLLAAIIFSEVVFGAEPEPVNKDLMLLNEKRARIEAQVRMKDLEIQQLVQEYQEVMNQINAISPPKTKSDVARPLPGEKPPPPAVKSPGPPPSLAPRGFQKEPPAK